VVYWGFNKGVFMNSEISFSTVTVDSYRVNFHDLRYDRDDYCVDDTLEAARRSIDYYLREPEHYSNITLQKITVTKVDSIGS
jgi:hypothetical protein